MEERTLRALQCNYNALLRWLVWGAEVILVTVCVFGFTGSVWAEGFQAVRIFLVAVFGLGLLVTVWSGLGTVYESSAEVLAKWRQKQGLPLYVRKFLCGRRPIRVEVGNYFYVDGGMTLTLFGIVAETTFSVLVAA